MPEASEFAGKLIEAKCRELFHLVTVKGRKYYVYRYEGNLNGIENAVVLLSYPAKSFGKGKALRAFISTNAALSDEEILDLYVVRWEIEVYFRDCKMKLAVDKYQIRSANGIKHFWLIASLAYMIACFESKRYNFSEGYHLLSQTIRREQISFIFDYFGEYCLTTFVHFHENGVGMLIYRCIFNSPTLLISSQERTKPRFVPKDVSPWKQVSVCYQIKSIEAR